MALLSIIEFFDESGEIMVAKVPQDGSGEFRLGSQLIVQESQVGIFYRDGQALDLFGPGRYTLETQNLPLLSSLIGLPFGGKSPFRAYVYFIATKTFISLGWGTPTPVLFRDTDFRMISLRAHGSYSLRIRQPRVFLNSIVGTRGRETTYAVEDFLRSIIVSRFNEVLGATMKSILDLPVLYEKMAQSVKENVRADFEQYGIELVDLVVEAVTPPPEVQAMINRASGIAAQDIESYRSIAASDAMRDAARNPGGAASEGLGAGVGLSLGLGMAQQISQTFAPPPKTDSPPAAQALSSAEVRAKLKELKELRDDELISEADFEEQKKRLLSLL